MPESRPTVRRLSVPSSDRSMSLTVNVPSFGATRLARSASAAAEVAARVAKSPSTTAEVAAKLAEPPSAVADKVAASVAESPFAEVAPRLAEFPSGAAEVAARVALLSITAEASAAELHMSPEI
jgi:hypothetical protein